MTKTEANQVSRQMSEIEEDHRQNARQFKEVRGVRLWQAQQTPVN